MVNAAECLLGFCSCSKNFEGDTSISVFWQQKFALIAFREHAPSVAGCSKIKYRVLTLILIKVQFRPVHLSPNKNILRQKKIFVEVWQKQLPTTNVEQYIYFEPNAFKNKDKSAHHLMKI